MASFEKISKANTQFCLDLFKKISEEDKTSNVFFSPFSISAAMAMVMFGTAGQTHDQISEVLCFTESDRNTRGEDPDPMLSQTLMQTQSPMQSQMQTRLQVRMQISQSRRLPEYLLKVLKPDGSADDIHSDICKLLKELKELSSLQLANRLYGEKTFVFLEEFLKGTKDKYGAELESVDFGTMAEEARKNINNWVEKNTESKIKDLLPEGAVGAATVLVLVNAIYFKEKWLLQFNKDDTIDAPFRKNKNEKTTVKMMRQKSIFNHAALVEENLQILEMLYVGEELSMIILLPDDIEDETTGLEKLEKELTYEKLMSWINSMTNNEVQVLVPQFKLEQKYEMKDILIRMGIVDAFDVTKSNFSGMSAANNLAISKVVHKAYVDVNEEGTEAAAATGVVIEERALSIPLIFKADHPFFFLIVHKPSMSVLFTGRYCNPE